MWRKSLGTEGSGSLVLYWLFPSWNVQGFLPLPKQIFLLSLEAFQEKMQIEQRDGVHGNAD